MYRIKCSWTANTLVTDFSTGIVELEMFYVSEMTIYRD